MKNRPLAFQIWVVISGILLAISILLLVLFSNTLRDFFTNETYTTIENEQHVLTEYRLPGSIERRYYSEEATAPTTVRSVQHVLLPESEDAASDRNLTTLSSSFIHKVYKLANKQDVKMKRYSEDVNGEKVFFVIKKGLSVNGQSAMMLSYALDSYRDDLAFTLFKQLLFILTGVILLSWIPAIWLAKYLSRPLVSFEKHVKRISEQDWDDPVIVDRQDEIGKLGHTIEDMRQKLVQKDETERTLLQNISHDLKTPVMVIRGYTQSIKDGIFPKGDLENTIDVIEGEAEKLEKKIKDLLYLTKLDYLLKQNVHHETFSIAEVTEEVIERLKWSRKELSWVIDVEVDTVMPGDPEQWSKLLENILENQIRYAETKIEVSIKKDVQNIFITIKNDGPHIEDEMLTSLYEPFNKGKKGEFGIGLSIVKRILTLHKASIAIENDKTGVTYRIAVPKK
ncbi:HAMP domain-containing sensor histidine kinase [Bacillus atrophaeus]|uniref:sensor histidine kinase n=1 Tax=Bacillus atrophaeus TaxID=1452 RepID=UPI00077A0CBC|nr:HAMP domain-containing sensor histidine kinase [Bacillus atrophaeus]KXZ19752.1 histidine kinase [Bacillus atrophaeus]MEC5222029.1 HAMP domain-containing sensor histidine kinase [Bacillus atrophaeus]MED4577620.1 HAMP domain-containing sensor histidine kinase [Bacillus atrophaeus]MED4719045.1 HAMP domain-containing sensor histidine kinase [Bacillus atrophaeus]MED4786071.1 HAMP domain-containing sensor histidine kinase [Bacillus atrophaeus]